MRIAETILKSIEDRGRRGLPTAEVYRHLYNPDLLLRAYGRIYKRPGATTQGITEETTDGMSMEKINSLIEQFRCECYQWTPVRRIYIPKKNGGRRPLGIPVWQDKLVQEAMRSLLEAYYEPQFSDLSHGFRPNRGCHSALIEISKWKGIDWFIEGDIKACFDSINHDLLLSILKEKIQDARFTGLLGRLLKAGYVEYGRHEPTPVGTPQGGPVSPVLANIYLDKLDRFVENTLIPRYTRGKRRTARHWREIVRQQDRDASNSRRLRYIRYADDFLIGFTGLEAEAQEVKRHLHQFLMEKLKLELSAEKTLVTHARTEEAQFLGYAIKRMGEKGQRPVADALSLHVPIKAMQERCSFYKKRGRIIPRAELSHHSDFDIMNLFQGRYMGYVQFYILAHNLHILNELRWVMETSLLMTLAKKRQTSVNQLAKQYETTIQTPHGPRKCLEMQVKGKQPRIARFGGVPLKRRKGAAIDRQPQKHGIKHRQPELIERLLANQCEYCGSMGRVEVHHVRKLADIDRGGRGPKPGWMQEMVAHQRKTLIVCRSCHQAIHSGKTQPCSGASTPI